MTLLLADVDCVSATSHRPHIGCQFFGLSWVFKLSPLEGLALRALGLWWWTETKAMDVDE